jgi:acetyl esterase
MSVKPGAKVSSKNNRQRSEGFWKRHKKLCKWLGVIFAGLALLIIVIFIWFRVSAWPGAMIIRYVFDKGGAKTAAALEKHAPKSGVEIIRDQQYKSRDVDAVLDVYMPQSALTSGQKLPVIIWTHGGAWISGSKDDASVYYQLLAQAGYIVITPNYSLAPDAKYPKAVHQLNAMYKYVQENADRFYADTSKIILAGDSAGSQLSAQMAALITNPAYAKEVGISPNLKPEQLKGVILTCGIYKMQELAHPNPTLSKVIGWGDSVVVWAYSGTKDFSDPIVKQMSPYYHVTKDFPPAFITGGNADPLTDVQSKPLARKLQSHGVNVTTLFYEPNHTPALPHEYQFNLDNADGKAALNKIIDFLNSRSL